MTRYAAFLRAVNVGGTGKLAMSELCAVCERAGFHEVKTYIQSGNVVLSSAHASAKVEATLTRDLSAHMNSPVDVMVRDAQQLARVYKDQPFAQALPQHVVVVFFHDVVTAQMLATAEARTGEQLVAHGSEVFIHYTQGQGKSKLKWAPLKRGTGRNINTVAKMCELLG